MENVHLPPEDVVRDYLESFDYFENTGYAEEGAKYLRQHLRRFIHTIEFAVPRLEGHARVLELGAAPYFLTFLLKRYLGYDVTVGNFFQDYGDPIEPSDGEVTIRSLKYGEEHHFAFKMFNVELDPLPYGDASFDMVLCCEILEHLALDPAHLVREVHRVLRPGGAFVITTPNAVRLEKVWAILRGDNVNDAYSGHGVYGRHNREYSPGEVGELLRVNNFHTHIRIEDAYPHGPIYRALARLFPHRRDNVFAVAYAHGPTIQVRPPWLYVSPETRTFVTRSRIVMGDREWLQLGAGWHPLEHLPPLVRWTGREAFAYLRPDPAAARLRIDAFGGPSGSRVRFDLNGYGAGSATLAPNEHHQILVEPPQQLVAEFRQGRTSQIDLRIVVEDPITKEHQGPHGPEAREIGIAVSRIELVP